MKQPSQCSRVNHHLRSSAICRSDKVAATAAQRQRCRDNGKTAQRHGATKPRWISLHSRWISALLQGASSSKEFSNLSQRQRATTAQRHRCRDNGKTAQRHGAEKQNHAGFRCTHAGFQHKGWISECTRNQKTGFSRLSAGPQGNLSIIIRPHSRRFRV